MSRFIVCGCEEYFFEVTVEILLRNLWLSRSRLSKKKMRCWLIFQIFFIHIKHFTQLAIVTTVMTHLAIPGTTQLFSERANSAMSTVPLKQKLCSSIMSHPESEKKFEILGFYWPRLRLRENDTLSCGKKEEKKPIKTRRRVKKYDSLSSTMKFSNSTSPSTSLLELLHDIPTLVSEEQAHLRSPITGKPIMSPKNKGSILIPAKPVRKQLERKSQSSDTFLSLGWPIPGGNGFAWIIFIWLFEAQATTDEFDTSTGIKWKMTRWLVASSIQWILAFWGFGSIPTQT